MKKCRKCGSEFKTWVLVDGKMKNTQRRKFCFDCSPYNSRNTVDLSKTENLQTTNGSSEKFCKRCGTTKDVSMFYKSSVRSDGLTVYCKKCTCSQSQERHKELKQMLVDEMGGKCEKCGYCKYIGALDFHHKDPKQKDFEIGKIQIKDLPLIRQELTKCALLCANCHREAHEELRQMGVEGVKPS